MVHKKAIKKVLEEYTKHQAAVPDWAPTEPFVLACER